MNLTFQSWSTFRGGGAVPLKEWWCARGERNRGFQTMQGEEANSSATRGGPGSDQIVPSIRHQIVQTALGNIAWSTWKLLWFNTYVCLNWFNPQIRLLEAQSNSKGRFLKLCSILIEVLLSPIGLVRRKCLAIWNAQNFLDVNLWPKPDSLLRGFSRTESIYIHGTPPPPPTTALLPSHSQSWSEPWRRH